MFFQHIFITFGAVNIICVISKMSWGMRSFEGASYSRQHCGAFTQKGGAPRSTDSLSDNSKLMGIMDSANVATSLWKPVMLQFRLATFRLIRLFSVQVWCLRTLSQMPGACMSMCSTRLFDRRASLRPRTRVLAQVAELMSRW